MRSSTIPLNCASDRFYYWDYTMGRKAAMTRTVPRTSGVPVRHFPRLLLTPICVLAALLTFASATARSASLTSVRFVYDWPVAALELVPIVVAQRMGFYEKHGLAVTVLFPPDAQTTARMLATSNADIGFEATSDLVFAANQGLPVLAIANFTHRNSWCLVGRAHEPIELGQLRGKSIGVFTDSWTKAMMSFVLKKAHLKEGDVRQIITQDDDIALLLAGKIDIATQAAAYAVAKFQDVAREQPTLACNDAIGVPDIPIWAFTASPAWLQLNGATAKAWLAATGDAIAWSVAHPSEAARIYTQAYPSAGTLSYNTVGWTYEAGLMNGPDGFFKQSDAQWNVLAQALKETGQIAAVKASTAYCTNAYLPD